MINDRSEADVYRDFSNNPEYPSDRKKKTPRDVRAPAPKKPRQPRAPEQASYLGQHWYDLGVAEGFEFPYDANFFALALERRIDSDPEIQKVAEDQDKVNRWVTKMIDIWWGHVDDDGRGGYLTNEITPRNAKEYFLVTDWADLREYARSSLRAAYLEKHGKRTPQPEYPNQQAYQKRLEEVQAEQRVRSFVAEVDLDAEPPKVDAKGRERLRSWREKRSKK